MVGLAQSYGVDGVLDVLVIGDRIAVVPVFVRTERLSLLPHGVDFRLRVLGACAPEVWQETESLRVPSRPGERARAARDPVPSWLPMPGALPPPSPSVPSSPPSAPGAVLGYVEDLDARRRASRITDRADVEERSEVVIGSVVYDSSHWSSPERR